MSRGWQTFNLSCVYQSWTVHCVTYVFPNVFHSNWCHKRRAACIQWHPATLTSSSDHLVRGHPTLHFPTLVATQEPSSPISCRFYGLYALLIATSFCSPSGLYSHSGPSTDSTNFDLHYIGEYRALCIANGSKSPSGQVGRLWGPFMRQVVSGH